MQPELPIDTIQLAPKRKGNSTLHLQQEPLVACRKQHKTHSLCYKLCAGLLYTRAAGCV
jgi:hypothetical protein